MKTFALTAIASAALWFAPTAQAQPDSGTVETMREVCSIVSEYGTGGINTIEAVMARKGMAVSDTHEAIQFSITMECPWNQAAMDEHNRLVESGTTRA